MTIPAEIGTYMPGPELDRLVEEHVFGHRTVQKWIHQRTRAIADRPGRGKDWFVERVIEDEPGLFRPIRKWSTDPAFTMQLLEHFRLNHLRVQINGDYAAPVASWEVALYKKTMTWRGCDIPADNEHRLPSLTLAACRAGIAYGLTKQRHLGSKEGAS